MCLVCESMSRPPTPEEEVRFHGWSAQLGPGSLLQMVTDLGPAATDVEAIGRHLQRGFWQANGMDWRAFDLAPGQAITVNVTALNGDGQALALAALAQWTAMTGITFQAVSGPGAQITFDDNQSGAYASTTVAGNSIVTSHVNVGLDWIAAYGTMTAGYSFQTYMHEIGHALGLGHAGNYNGTANFGTQAINAQDSWQISVMSYFSQSQNANTNASFAWVPGLMMADLWAIEALYGLPSTINAGATVWGVGSNAGAVMAEVGQMMATGTLSRPVAFTIIDRGGADELNVSTDTRDQRINLNAGAASSVFGLRENVLIERRSTIEAARAGAGNDMMLGNAVSNSLWGNAGRDEIDGAGGNDLSYGGAGNDSLTGGLGSDILYGGTETDMIAGDDGNDRAYGDDGHDSVTGGAGGDQLFGGTGNDSLLGEAAGDKLYGGAGDDSLTAGDGNDALLGDAGNDAMDGGQGADVMRGGDGTDLLQGGTEGDNLQGENGADSLWGGDGNDQLFGGNDDDALWGGEGLDSLRGGAGQDRLWGEGAGDVLQGEAGQDQLQGGDGNDSLSGGTGNDTLTGGAGHDTLTGGTEADLFVFAAADAASTDQITDFARDADRIDLSALDADPLTAGDQALTFVGAGPVDAAGEAGFVADGSGLWLTVELNGTAGAEITILLAGITALTSADLIL